MDIIKIYIGNFSYNEKSRSFLVDILKPLIPSRNLTKYNLKSLPIMIVEELHDSDCILLPYTWNYYLASGSLEIAEKMIRQSQALNRKIFIWFTGDQFYSLDLPKSVIGFYNGPYKSKQDILTISIPVIVRDPLLFLELETIIIQKLLRLPLIGFCGHVDPNIFISFIKFFRIFYKKFNYFFNLTQEYPGSIIPPTFLRKNILDILEDSREFQVEFLRRSKYKAGVRNDSDMYNIVKQDFYKNICATNYTLCIRGTGNFSARLFETLALGRIPIFINTDCILPFNDLINWNEHMIFIDQSNLRNLQSTILNFHQNLTEDSFINIQKKNRTLWEKNFSFYGAINNIVKEISKHIR